MQPLTGDRCAPAAADQPPNVMPLSVSMTPGKHHGECHPEHWHAVEIALTAVLGMDGVCGERKTSQRVDSGSQSHCNEAGHHRETSDGRKASDQVLGLWRLGYRDAI